MPGPTQEATLEFPLLAPAPITFQFAWTTCAFLLSTGTTKSKLWADNVLKIKSKLQSGFGPTHTPETAPVGMLQVKPVPRAAQSASAVHTFDVGACVQAVSCENSWLLIC